MVVLARDETASLIAIFADGRYEVFASGVAIPLWTQRGLVWAPPPGNSVVAVRGDGDDGFALLTGTGDGESAVWTDITFSHDGVQTGAHAVAPHDAFATANAELAYGLDLDGDGSIGFEAVETLVETSTETSTETSAPSVVRPAEGGPGVRDGGGMTVLVQGGAGDDQHMDEDSFSASGTIIDDGAAASGGGTDAGQTEHATFPGPDDGSELPPQPDDALSLLVKFAPGTSMADVMAAASAVGGGLGDVVRGEGNPLNPGGVVQTFGLGRGADPDLAIQILNRLPGVEYAERNWTVSIEALSVEATSDDPYYSGGNLWGMYGDDPSTSPTNQYGSQAADAWLSGQTGSMSSVVGVIDTGIDPTHPDLYLNIWLNQEEIPSALAAVLNDIDGDGLITFRDLNHSDNAAYLIDGNGNGRRDARDILLDDRWADGVDTDGNGFIDDFYGWDFHNDDNDPFDDQGHGTHVAGTIGALSNTSGVVGVAWNVQIMALKFLSSSGTGDIADAVRATDYFTLESGQSTGQHFVATNNSWGGGGYSSTMEQAIVDGAIADILFVASAGNGRWPRGGVDNDKSDHYPSDYDTTLGAGYDAVVAVASIDSNGNLSSFSNYGAVDVDLGAPGSSIWSTVPGGGYANYSGTSMAAPHVTGSLALAASLSPGTSAEDLRDALLASTTYTQSLDGRTVTDGRLNVDTFVDVMDTVVVTAPVVGVHPLITNDTTPALTGTVDDSAATIYVTVASQNFLATNNGNGTWTLSDNTLSPLSDGVYDVVVTADAGGNVGSDSTTDELTIDTVDPAAPSVAALTTNDTTPTVTGTASVAAGETLSVHVAGTDYTEGNGLTLSGSDWSLTVGGALTDATYDVTATVTDAAGNSTNDATSGELVIDTTGPAVAITDITTDTGVSNLDFVTSDRSLVFSGTAEAGAVISLSLNDVFLDNVVADGNGAWQFDHQGTELSDATYTLEASASDSLNSTVVSQNVTVDRQTPVVSIGIADMVLSVGETTALTFTFSEVVFGFDAADVDVSGAGGGTLNAPSSADGGLTWTATFTPNAGIEVDLATIAVTASGYADLAGNSGTGATSDPFTVDTQAPTVTPAVASADAVGTGVEITGTVGELASDEMLLVLRDDVVIGNTVRQADGTWSFIDGDTLAAGAHQYSAFVQDDVGNVGPGSNILEYTVEGDLFVFGTDGSDTLVGSGLADTISGLPNPAEGSTALGEKTIDVLTGMGGNDVFVLGDSRGAFYDDDNPQAANNGKSDYAQINDFMAGDQIHLSGSPADYLLNPWTAPDGTVGTGIFIDYGNGSFDARDELIGLVAGEVTLDLYTSDFVYNDDFLYV